MTLQTRALQFQMQMTTPFQNLKGKKYIASFSLCNIIRLYLISLDISNLVQRVAVLLAEYWET